MCKVSFKKGKISKKNYQSNFIFSWLFSLSLSLSLSLIYWYSILIMKIIIFSFSYFCSYSCRLLVLFFVVGIIHNFPWSLCFFLSYFFSIPKLYSDMIMDSRFSWILSRYIGIINNNKKTNLNDLHYITLTRLRTI